MAILVGLGVAALVKRRASAQSAWARPSGRAAVAVATALMVAVVGWAAVYGSKTGNPFAETPTFASLRAHPEATIHGTVAYDALATPNATKTGKVSCVMAVAAGGGATKKLLCVPVTKAMGPTLRWTTSGHLEVTARGGTLWRKDVDLATGALTTLAYQKPAPPVTTGPHGEKVSWTNSGGRFEAVLTVGSSRTTLLTVNAPPVYGWEDASWSSSSAWFTVADSSGRILVVTTSNPKVRVLVPAGELPVASDYVLGA